MLECTCISGVVIPQIFSTSMSSPPSDCLASVDTCMSNLCKLEQALYGGSCDGKNDTFLICYFCCGGQGTWCYPYISYSGIIKVMITFPQDMRLCN